MQQTTPPILITAIVLGFGRIGRIGRIGRLGVIGGIGWAAPVIG